ncbi:peroxiredoxin [Pigmentibacter ruber]|uniref:peroxiredoxin n=1 Tax=Pigmentibacter ruber TaxID=2683196 RepID=UPI00131AD492|nr:peroxiredoxin [Pigmentibacter ruber]BFD32591.1 thioredoxin-dependent thiol peroxidase [Pigmentibacter ruber]
MPTKKTEQSPILQKPYKVKKFSVVDENGNNITEKTLLGKWNVIYFYPKDMTSGCTLEANDFQTKLKTFHKFGCDIYGVSKDSCQSHLKFIQKEGLKFTLLSDEEGKLLENFAVWKEKSMYGKKYMGIERSTFLINKEGMVVAEWRKVKVTEHVETVLEVLKQLTSS